MEVPAADPRLNDAVVILDPRIHFALVRGTRSCPQLQVYEPARLDEQLDAATRDYLGRHVEVAAVSDILTNQLSTSSSASTSSGAAGADEVSALAAALKDASLGSSGLSSPTSIPLAARAPLRRQILLPALVEWYQEDFGSSDLDVLKVGGRDCFSLSHARDSLSLLKLC